MSGDNDVVVADGVGEEIAGLGGVGEAYDLPSPNAKKLMALFHKICRENGILSNPDDCFRYISELPEQYPQLSMFDPEQL